MVLVGADLGFTEFALVAILLAVMYAVSAMHVAAMKGRAYLEKPFVKRGAVWAVMGIVFALLFGTAAALGTGLPFEGPALAFLLLFPGGWVWAELAHGRVASSADINRELDGVYRRAILRALEQESPRDGGDLWEAVSGDRFVEAIGLLPSGSSVRGIGPGIIDIMEEWKLTHERFTALLEDMCSSPDGGVVRNSGDTYSLRR
jgi:hypothetical protein